MWAYMYSALHLHVDVHDSYGRRYRSIDLHVHVECTDVGVDV